MSYFDSYYPGVWERYRPKRASSKSLLTNHEKSRRSAAASTSFGIRASALDSQNDLERRRKEREERFERMMGESRKDMMEIFQKFAKLEAVEKDRKAKEESEKELERKEKEEQEQESHEILISNDVSFSFVELNLQELEDEIPNESTSNKLANLRKNIDIIPSAPLFTQPIFLSQVLVNNKDEAIDCVVEDTNANQKLFVDDLFLYEKKFFDGLFQRKIHVLFIGVCSQGRNASSMFLEQIKFDFQIIVFDPGG